MAAGEELYMAVAYDPDLSWAITKALMIVCSGFASIVCLTWIAIKKTSLK